MKLTAPQTERLTRAVEAAEAKTSVELVLTVVQRSRSYLAGPAAAGLAVAFVTLGLALFLEEPEVDPALVGPLVGFAGLAGFLLAMLAPTPLLSRLTTRRTAVDTAAHAAFSRQGVHRTTGRTGMLVFLSLSEREARLLPDQGVLAAVPGDVRKEWSSQLNTIAARFDAEALAKTLEAIGERAGGYLPRAEGDVNELPNAPTQGTPA